MISCVVYDESAGRIYEHAFYMDTELAIIALLGTASNLVHQCFFVHEHTDVHRAFEARLSQESDIEVQIFGSDGASSVEKALHYTCNEELPKKAMPFIQNCSSHDQAICEAG